MKAKRAFREPNVPGAALAFDPQAFGWMFEEAQGCGVDITRGGTAIISIDGPLEHKANWFFDSYEAIRERFDAALSDPEAVRIVLKISSPGGECAGCFETVEAMRASAAAAGKQVISFVDEHAYSAGYALACVGETIVIPKTGGVGSVGVLQIMVDATKMDQDIGLAYNFVTSGTQKADGNPHAGISKEVLSRAQSRVDDLAGMFFDLVATSRGVSAESVKSLQAGCFYGQEAIANGLADEVMSLDELIATLEANASESTETQTPTKGDKQMKLSAKKIQGVKAYANPKLSAEGDEKKEEKEMTEEEKKEAEKKAAEEKEKEDAAGKEEDGECAEDDKSSGDLPASDDEDDEEEDKESASAFSVKDVLAAVAQVTGKKSPVDMIASLHTMAARASSSKRISAESHRMKVEAMISEGDRAGKLPPTSHAYWRSVAMKGADGLKLLKGHLSNMGSGLVTLAGEGATPPPAVSQEVARDIASGTVSGLDAHARSIAAKMNTTPEAMAATAKAATRNARGRIGIGNPLHAVK